MNSKNKEFLLTSPSFLWLIFFFLIPTLLVFAYAFKPSDIYGGIKEGWTLSNFKILKDPHYYVLILRTLALSVLTTFICITLALPVCYTLLSASKGMRKFLLLLIVVPFWSSFLIRIFAWKMVLHPEGMLKNFLVQINLIHPQTTLLYNNYAVLLVMVYTYLPFAVFPIYAAASKFNLQLMEVAYDLGASKRQAFFKVFIPGIKKGIFTGMLMVFIPAIGAYVIPDLVGGTHSEMIGNRIAQKTFLERNLPEASALSTLLALSVLFPILATTYLTKRSKRIEEEAISRE